MVSLGRHVERQRCDELASRGHRQGWQDTKQYQPQVDAVKAQSGQDLHRRSFGGARANAVDDELNDKRIVLVCLTVLPH